MWCRGVLKQPLRKSSQPNVHGTLASKCFHFLGWKILWLVIPPVLARAIEDFFAIFMDSQLPTVGSSFCNPIKRDKAARYSELTGPLKFGSQNGASLRG